MLKDAPSPVQAAPAGPAFPRAPYFFQDPLRLGGIACVVLLLLVKEPPMALGLLVVGLSQSAAVAMVVDLVGRGWSRRHGRRARSAHVANSMAMDWTHLNVCSLAGAMLLMRLFGAPEPTGRLVWILGLLALGIALVPDVRLCRLILPGDPRRASDHLERGGFWRDPVKLGGLAALAILSVLDETSLAYLLLSMMLLQVNSFLMLVDKYLGELDLDPASRRYRSLTLRLVLARDGQRLLVTLLPLLFVAARLVVDPAHARWGAAVVATLIVLPDVLRLAWSLFSTALFRVTGTDTRRLKTLRPANLGGI